MKKCRVDSIANLESRPFDKLGIKFLRMLEGWPVSIIHENIPKYGDVPYVVHMKTSELVYLLSGEAKAYLGNDRINVRAGDYLLIPPGVKHRFVTGKKPLIALSVFCPPMNWEKLDAVMCKGAGNKKRNSSGKLKRLPVQNK